MVAEFSIASPQACFAMLSTNEPTGCCWSGRLVRPKSGCLCAMAEGGGVIRCRSQW